MNRRDESTELILGAALTALVHGALIAFVVIGSVAPKGVTEPLELPVITADLLRLGEVMPNPGELPELHNPAPAPTSNTPAVPRTPDAAPSAPAEPTEVAREEVALNRESEQPAPAQQEQRPPAQRPTAELPRPSSGDDNRSASVGVHDPSRPVTDGPSIGSPDGFAGGLSLSDSAMRNQFARIQSQLNSAFERPSGLSPEQLRGLSVQIYIKVTVQGRISEYRIVRSSGNNAFDFRARQMANKFREGPERLDIGSISNTALRQDLLNRGFIARIPE